MYKYDLSLPPNDMYKLVEETRARMKHLPVTVVGYGHMGDSNLHLNISAGQSCCLQLEGHCIKISSMLLQMLAHEHTFFFFFSFAEPKVACSAQKLLCVLFCKVVGPFSSLLY